MKNRVFLFHFNEEIHVLRMSETTRKTEFLFHFNEEIHVLRMSLKRNAKQSVFFFFYFNSRDTCPSNECEATRKTECFISF